VNGKLTFSSELRLARRIRSHFHKHFVIKTFCEPQRFQKTAILAIFYQDFWCPVKGGAP